MQVWFAKDAIHNYRDARHADQKIFDVGWRGMLARGVLFHPGLREPVRLDRARMKTSPGRSGGERVAAA